MKRVSLTLALLAVTFGFAYSQDHSGGTYEQLKEYDPLIGTWVYDGPLKESIPEVGDEGSNWVATLTYRWIVDKNAVAIDWKTENEGGKNASGIILIGWDSAAKQIISRSFSTAGATSSGVHRYDPDKEQWIISSKGVNGEGEPRGSTVIVTRTGQDTFTWIAKDRYGGQATGDSPRYEFTRK